MDNQLSVIGHLPQTRQQAVTLLAHSPDRYWNSINPKCIEDVFDAPEVGFGTMIREMGIERVRAMLVIWFEPFIRFYSTNGTMDAEQMADTINLALEAYPHYTIYDLKLFFKMAKLRSFGQTYGRIDGDVILGWMKEYDKRRDGKAQEMSISQSNEYKAMENKKLQNVGGMFYDEYLKWKKENEKADSR